MSINNFHLFSCQTPSPLIRVGLYNSVISRIVINLHGIQCWQRICFGLVGRTCFWAQFYAHYHCYQASLCFPLISLLFITTELGSSMWPKEGFLETLFYVKPRMKLMTQQLKIYHSQFSNVLRFNTNNFLVF